VYLPRASYAALAPDVFTLAGGPRKVKTTSPGPFGRPKARTRRRCGKPVVIAIRWLVRSAIEASDRVAGPISTATQPGRTPGMPFFGTLVSEVIPFPRRRVQISRKHRQSNDNFAARERTINGGRNATARRDRRRVPKPAAIRAPTNPRREGRGQHASTVRRV